MRGLINSQVTHAVPLVFEECRKPTSCARSSGTTNSFANHDVSQTKDCSADLSTLNIAAPRKYLSVVEISPFDTNGGALK
jgi:hypothetical protein